MMSPSGVSESRKVPQAKIVMVGDCHVGKTSILSRYTEPCPAASRLCAPASYIATIGIDFKVKTISLNGTQMKLQIWDTAGQERFHTFTTSYFRGAHGFVLVYDMTSTESFQGIANWMKDIHEKADENTEIILLGNKCDKEKERVIPKNEGEKLAWEYGIHFFETSAKDNINIEDAFSVLAEELLNKSSSVLPSLDLVDLSENTRKRTCCKL